MVLRLDPDGHSRGHPLLNARPLSRATRHNRKENLLWAFGYNATLVPVAAGVRFPFVGVLLNPILAGGAMEFSSLSVLLNALRLRRFKARYATATR